MAGSATLFFSVLHTPFRVMNLNISHPLHEPATLACLLFRTLAIAACLALAAPASAAVDEPVPSPAPEASAATGIADARALMWEGQFEEALAVLRPLARGHEAGANVLFLFGRAATEASRRPGISETTREALLDEAIAAFRAMLIDSPGLVRVRLELARAFFLKSLIRKLLSDNSEM